MKKLPPNAKRVTELARKPVCACYAKNKTRVAKRGEVSNV
jgi:hypothetical protein